MTRRQSLFLIAAIFVGGGIMHFVVPDRYASIMPPWIPHPMEMVYLSGVFELLGGVGVLVPRARKMAGIGLIALLVAVFPANVQMLGDALRSGASALSIIGLFLRLPLQPLMIVWIYRAAVRHPQLRPA
ncbi:MAG: DoxX family protein [Gemmatimonadaceae bacterium]